MMRIRCFIALPVLFLVLAASGCRSASGLSGKLPSEDIEVLEVHKDLIAILKSDRFPADSQEKYEAARKLIRRVDFSYTRELRTVNSIFNYKDMLVDDPASASPVFSFNYRWRDHYVRIRFFSHKMFVTRVEITEK